MSKSNRLDELRNSPVFHVSLMLAPSLLLLLHRTFSTQQWLELSTPMSSVDETVLCLIGKQTRMLYPLFLRSPSIHTRRFLSQISRR
jgi:hypothetical protein